MDRRKRAFDGVLAGDDADAIGFGNGFGRDPSEVGGAFGKFPAGNCNARSPASRLIASPYSMIVHLVRAPPWSLGCLDWRQG